jgi:hypothetical protein
MSKKASADERHRWFIETSRQMGKALVAATDAPFEELEATLRVFEKRMLAAARTERQRREVRRRIAENLFTEAFGRSAPWSIFGPTLRRIQRLGYSNVERRYHVACLYALWCREHPEHDSREARGMLDEAERRILRLPRNHIRRQELLAHLPGVRARSGFQAGTASSR